MIGGSILVASATAGKVDNVTLCHASPPDQFVYQGNEPLTRDPDSIVKANGHDSHPADIIPAFDYETFENDPYDGHYPGKNLDKLSWIANGCAAPAPPKTNVNVSTVVFDAATDKALVDLNLTAGGSVYDTSRVVTPSAIPAATGTISYTFYNNNTCAGPGTPAGSLFALGSKSNTEANLIAGSYSFKATYSGDSHYNGNTSACEPFTVTAAPPLEKKVTLCHADSNSKQPYGPKPIDVSINSVGDAEDVNGHGTHTGPVFPGEKWGDIIPPFTYGDFSYPGMNWDTAGQAIFNNGCAVPPPPTKKDVNVSTVVFDAATDKALVDLNLTAGGSVYDTSRVVTPSAIPAATGTISYTFYNNNTCAGPGTPAGSLFALGSKSNTEANLIAGSYSFKATYSGDSHYNGNTSACEPFTVTEGPYDPSTTTTTVVFNAATDAALVGNLPVNGSVYDTSTVKHLGGGTPTGTIAYTFYTNNTCSGDGTSAGSGLALGTKSSTKGPLAAGQYSFKAAFTSNDLKNFNSSTSDCEPFTVSPAQLNPTPSPSGGVLAATGATPPTQDLAISLIALGLIAMMGGAFAWRRREA